MTVPRWLLFLVAAWVIAFGLFRIFVALRPRRDEDGPNFMRKGLYARTPRSHVAFGALYLLLGGFLVATGFGWTPVMDLASCSGNQTSVESPDSHTAAPTGDRAGGK